MLLFSIVVPNYNYGQYLQACLDSLAGQTLDARCFEVLFADDGSSDDSLVRVRQWAAAHPQVHLRLLPGAHLGHPGAVRNRAAAEAQAPWLLCLDSDDMLEAGTLAALAQAQEAVGAGGVATGVFPEACGGHRPQSSTPPVVLAPDCVEARGDALVPVPVPPFDADLIRRQHPCSHALCYPLALWRSVGGYDESNPYEDWDLLLRVVARGAVWQRVPGAVHVYRVHAGSVSEGAQRRDAAAKADMVLRSAHFFASEVVWWARQLRDGAPWVFPFPRGIIPSAENLHHWHAQCVEQMGRDAEHFFPAKLFGRPTL